MNTESPRGQVLIIVAAGMVALVAAVGLIIDGGHLWSRQRDTQNGTDAAAEAGAIALVQVLRGEIAAGAAGPIVCQAVEATAAENGIDVETAWYTDLAGVRMAVAIDATGLRPGRRAAGPARLWWSSAWSFRCSSSCSSGSSTSVGRCTRTTRSGTPRGRQLVWRSSTRTTRR